MASEEPGTLGWLAEIGIQMTTENDPVNYVEGLLPASEETGHLTRSLFNRRTWFTNRICGWPTTMDTSSQ